MTSLLVDALSRRRLIGALAALLLAVGLAAWLTMPRQEDPSFVPRFATVVVPFPGADPLRVERRVLEPLEDELATVEALREVDATARSGVAVLQLRLQDQVYDTDAAWDEVRRALSDAVLPAEAGPVRFDDDIGDPASVVLLVTGSADRLALRDAARQLEVRLRQVPGVARVDWVGDPGAEVRVTVDPGAARRLGIEPQRLAGLLSARNLTLPGGSLARDGRTVVLRPHTELASLDELRASPIALPGGAAVPLHEVARVELGPEQPAPSRVRHDGQPAVGLAVVPAMPRDLVRFGEQVRQATAEVDLGALQVEVFADQPAQVADRLGELSRSLVMGVVIVALVLLLAMGPRLGLVVASVVPLVAISTVGVYAAGGGVLHQISIAALVLALGLLVDNAIVVAEAVQQALDQGEEPEAAARSAVRQLAMPLFTATGTTLAAFLPMLLSRGGTADFTRAIPVVVVTSLVLSYLAAVAVTPLLAAWALRPAPRAAGRLERLAGAVGRWVTSRPLTVVAGVAAVLAATASLLPAVEQEFFPLSDQTRVVVTAELPEGTHIDRTDEAIEGLAADLRTVDGVAASTSFIGRGPPRFYYNLNDVPSAPHAATVVLDVQGRDAVPRVLSAVRARARRVPEAVVVAKRLQQGPPVGAPVELRITGGDLDQLQAASVQAVRILRATEGTEDVRSTLGLGVAQLAMAFDDAASARRGVGRADVAAGLLGQTRGLDAGLWTGGWDDVPVRVRGVAGQQLSPDRIAGLGVGPRVPLGQVVNADLRWVPAAVHHRDGVRQVRVLAELAADATFSDVMARAQPHLDAAELGDVQLAWGGESEGSGEANAALLAAVPAGVGLLLVFLLLEFDSARRAGLVLLTVPLAATGVVPGLALSGAPFGFMSLLGVIALTGIVVNNAIVLIDRIDRAREEGLSVPEAVQDAVRVRLRPILLTTATTVSGMLPLALSGSSLWPPLAWAMISGLLASTLLTVLVVPAMYVVLFHPPARPRRLGRAALPATVLLLTWAAGPVAHAEELTLDELLQEATDAPVAVAATEGAASARHGARATWLSAVGPAVGATVETVERGEPVEVDTPFGPLPQQAASQADAGAEASVPLLRAAGWAEGAAATRGARAARAAAERQVQDHQLQVASVGLDLATLQARRQAQATYVASLQAVAQRVRDRREVGLGVEADALRAEVALADAEQQLFALDQQIEATGWQLGALLGRPGPVALAPLTPAAADAPPSDAGTASDPERGDVRAADHQVAQRAAERAAVALQWVPELDAYGAYRWTDNDALVDGDWFEGGVRLTWTVLARGTRGPRIAASAAQRRQAQAQATAVRRQVRADRQAALAALRTAQQAVTVRTRAAAQAEEARAVVDSRYGEGRATLTDVLQVQAQAVSAEAERAVAEVEVHRAGVQLRWATGRL